MWYTVQGYLLLQAAVLMEWTRLWSKKSGGFYELLIKKHLVTPLAGQLGVWKVTHTLFQRVWPKIHKTVTSFMHLYTTCIQTKDRTAVPPGLLQPLPVPESCLFSQIIDFTTNLPLYYGCYTILTCLDHLTKYTIPISCKTGDETMIAA